MTTSEQRSIEETARLGEDLYETKIWPEVEPGHVGEVIAIDVDSGAYALADTAGSAAKRLREKRPGAQVWLMRVGFETLRSFGGGSRRRKR